MALQLSTAVRNARADALETAIGVSPSMEIRTGAPPASCQAAATGTLLATLTLPADWMSNASNGAKALAGTWSGVGAAAAGAGTAAGYFRIVQGGTCHVQGTITAPGGGGDMVVVNTSLAQNQPFSVDTFSLTEANA